MSALEDLRLRAGLSRAELAQKAGVARDTVRLLEEGRCKPRVATARRLAPALGIEVTAVLEAAQRARWEACAPKVG